MPNLYRSCEYACKGGRAIPATNAEMYALKKRGGGVSEAKSTLPRQGAFWPWTDTPTAQSKDFARLSAYWGIHWGSRTAAFVNKHSFAVRMLRPKRSL